MCTFYKRIVPAILSLAAVFVVVHTATGFGDDTLQPREQSTHGASDDFVQYRSHGNDYTFRRPASWAVYEQPHSKFPYVRISNIDREERRPGQRQNAPSLFKVEVVTLPNEKQLPLAGWVNELVTTSPPLPTILEKRNITVAGEVAIYQLEQVGSSVHPVVYIAKGANVYLINFSSNDEQFVPIAQQVVNSFVFNRQ